VSSIHIKYSILLFYLAIVFAYEQYFSGQSAMLGSDRERKQTLFAECFGYMLARRSLVLDVTPYDFQSFVV
jgi:hypothetical protein